MALSFAFIKPELLFWPTVILLVSWWLIMRLRRGAGIWRLRFFAMPRPWMKYLHAHVPHYARLPWELRAPYQDKALHFMDSKIFRPGGSMEEITEPLRMAIGGNACILQLNTESTMLFPEILTVQLYGLQDEEVTSRSSVVPLLWDAAKEQPLDPFNRGREAALTTIAAALGMKALPQPLLLTPWARTMVAEFTARAPGALEKAVPGSDPVEVFAIATEVFYAAPAVLLQTHPALYDALRLFYRVDPARWAARQ